MLSNCYIISMDALGGQAYFWCSSMLRGDIGFFTPNLIESYAFLVSSCYYKGYCYIDNPVFYSFFWDQFTEIKITYISWGRNDPFIYFIFTYQNSPTSFWDSSVLTTYVWSLIRFAGWRQRTWNDINFWDSFTLDFIQQQKVVVSGLCEMWNILREEMYCFVPYFDLVSTALALNNIPLEAVILEFDSTVSAVNAQQAIDTVQSVQPTLADIVPHGLLINDFVGAEEVVDYMSTVETLQLVSRCGGATLVQMVNEYLITSFVHNHLLDGSILQPSSMPKIFQACARFNNPSCDIIRQNQVICDAVEPGALSIGIECDLTLHLSSVDHSPRSPNPGSVTYEGELYTRVDLVTCVGGHFTCLLQHNSNLFFDYGLLCHKHTSGWLAITRSSDMYWMYMDILIHNLCNVNSNALINVNSLLEETRLFLAKTGNLTTSPQQLIDDSSELPRYLETTLNDHVKIEDAINMVNSLTHSMVPQSGVTSKNMYVGRLDYHSREVWKF